MLCDSRAAVMNTSSHPQTKWSMDLCDSNALLYFLGCIIVSATVTLPSFGGRSVPIKISLWNHNKAQEHLHTASICQTTFNERQGQKNVTIGFALRLQGIPARSINCQAVKSVQCNHFLSHCYLPLGQHNSWETQRTYNCGCISSLSLWSTETTGCKTFKFSCLLDCYPGNIIFLS